MNNTRFAVALHILTLLAVENKCQPTTSEYLAESANTNPVVIRRLLGSLRRCRLDHCAARSWGRCNISPRSQGNYVARSVLCSERDRDVFPRYAQGQPLLYLRAKHAAGSGRNFP